LARQLELLGDQRTDDLARLLQAIASVGDGDLAYDPDADDEDEGDTGGEFREEAKPLPGD
jgi:hypothetical protein